MPLVLVIRSIKCRLFVKGESGSVVEVECSSPVPSPDWSCLTFSLPAYTGSACSKPVDFSRPVNPVDFCFIISRVADPDPVLMRIQLFNSVMYDRPAVLWSRSNLDRLRLRPMRPAPVPAPTHVAGSGSGFDPCGRLRSRLRQKKISITI